MAKLRLVKIGAAWCPPCKAMARAKTLERFQEKHPTIKVEAFELPENWGDEEDAEDGERAAVLGALDKERTADERKAVRLAEQYEITGIPTMILLDGEKQVGRIEEACTLKRLEELLAEANPPTKS